MKYLDWLRNQRNPRYAFLRVMASDPTFPETNDVRALESAFFMRGMAGEDVLIFRYSWMRYREQERKRERMEAKHDQRGAGNSSEKR